MSDQSTTASVTVIQPTSLPPQATPPLVSSSYANQGTAAASGGAAAAAMIVMVWIVQGLAHVTIPAEVAAAMTTLMGMAVHWLVLKYGFPANN